LVLHCVNGYPAPAEDRFSLEPKELAQLCKDSKTAWQALGKVNDERTEAEKEMLSFAGLYMQ